MDFRPKKHLGGTLKRQFLRNPAGTKSCVIVGHFYGPDGLTKFRWQQYEIKGTYNSKVGMACNGQNPGLAPKNDP